MATVHPDGQGLKEALLCAFDLVAWADLAWWDCFLQSWLGTSFMIPGDSLTTQLYSDTSGTFGCGAITSDNRWLQVQ